MCAEQGLGEVVVRCGNRLAIKLQCLRTSCGRRCLQTKCRHHRQRVEVLVRCFRSATGVNVGATACGHHSDANYAVGQ